MKVQPSPTSPKAAHASKSEDLAKLYASDEYTSLSRPYRYSRTSTATFLFSALVGALAGLCAGIVFFTYGMNSLFSGAIVPLQKNITPPAIRRTIEPKIAVSTILAAQQSLVALFEAHAGANPEDAYYPAQQVGTGVLVSNDGWAVSVLGIFAPEKKYVAVTADRKVLLVNQLVRDTGSGLAYFRLDGTGFSVASTSTADPDLGATYDAVLGSGTGTVSRIIPLSIIDTHLLNGTPFASSDGEAIMYKTEELPATALGAAVVDSHGSVVGLVGKMNPGDGTLIFPAGYIRNTIKGILQNGAILRPELGVHYIDLALAPGVSESARAGKVEGALIAGTNALPAVLAGSPADEIGLKSGDVITEIDGRPLSETTNLSTLIQQSSPGDTIQIRYFRANTEKKVKVTLATLGS